MSKASELEAARLAAERNDARCAAIHDALETVHDNMPGGATEPDALGVLAEQLLAEATFISEQRKTAWKSRSDAHTAAGRILEQWAKDLAAYLERDKPPTRPPLETIKSPDRHAGLDPADGPISAQITSGLLAATGAPKYAAEPQCRVEYPTPAGVAPGARIVRCGKVAGHAMTPGDEPHAEWIEGADNDGASGWGPEWTLPTSAPNNVVQVPPGGVSGRLTVDPAAIAMIKEANTAYFWPDGAITPDAATRVRLAVEADKDTDAKLDAAFGPIVRIGREIERENPGTFDRLAGIEPPLKPIDDKVTRGPEAWPVITGPPDGVTLGPEAPPPGTQVYIVTNLDQVPQFSEPGAAPARQTQQRMTFEAVREHGTARARGADHRSYSQVQAFSECGIRYALSDLDVTPAWWNVGGTALHFAVEWLNREVSTPMQPGEGDPKSLLASHAEHMVKTLWTNCLNRSVSETITAHPIVGPDQWRAAKKGTEGYDWWRVHGLDMVRRWITRLTWFYDQGWTIATVDGKPAIELDAPMWILVPAGEIKVENILDLVMVRGDTFLIVDFKSGASDPTSTYQLGQYGHALAHGLGFTAHRIHGAYWLARTDTFGPFDMPKLLDGADIRDVHPWSEIEYLITTMHTAESQGLYLPNKSKSDRFGCGSCGVSGLCPVGPR